MPSNQTIACVRVSGPDQKGIIAAVTTYFFKNNINIEDIDQRILENFLTMNMQIDLKDCSLTFSRLKEELIQVGHKIGMEITLRKIEERKIKNVALLVTKEAHTLITLLKDMKSKKIKGRPAVIISNRPDLKEIGKHYKVPFYYFPADNKKEHESHVLQKLAEYETDLVVLARYMQILSPEFCFRYEGKIINIHPSLLPAFPGARPYAQAYHKGVEVVGVTAHFVTTDLDQGPIIAQESFRIDKTHQTLEEVIKNGKKMEAKALARAVKLFCEDRLMLRRGKVIDNQKMHRFEEKIKEFYR